MKDNRLTRHHIIPKSLLKGKQLKGNIVMVSHLDHDKYHQLFSNKTPEEILLYLVNTFWGGNIQIIKDFLWEMEH